MGDLDGGDLVGGGFGFDAGDGYEVLDGVGEAAVAVDPVFLEGGDGFLGVGFGEFAVGVDAELCVGEVGGGDECGERLSRKVAKARREEGEFLTTEGTEDTEEERGDR